jgi:hypothetical protein
MSLLNSASGKQNLNIMLDLTEHQSVYIDAWGIMRTRIAPKTVPKSITSVLISYFNLAPLVPSGKPRNHENVGLPVVDIISVQGQPSALRYSCVLKLIHKEPGRGGIFRNWYFLN